MARTSLTTGSATANAPKFTTGTIAPHQNTLILLYVTSAAPLLGPTPPVPTISGNGLAWVLVDSVAFGTGNKRRLSCFRTMGTPVGGAITIDFGGQAQDLCAWSVFEFDGVDTSGTSGGSAVRQAVKKTATGSSLTANLAGGAAGNASAGGIALDTAQSVTPGAGFTEIHKQIPAQPLGQGGALETEDATAVVPAVTWTWGTTANAAAIAVEVSAAPATPPTPPSNDEQLIRRFEPVLFLHPQDMFFPVDAKRYIEHAALWSATSLFDDKNNWQRVVAPGDLAASDTEPGTYLGNELGTDDERFLELGGWKDKSGSAEPDVSGSTTNLYANRDAIADAYRGDLAGSQFWYHGEVFPTDRLRALAGGPPNLRKTLDNLGLNQPTLLCYYLFFPAHQQSVGMADCSSVDAVEVSCHSGDWQCIALLLDGDGSGQASGFKPKYFGVTGTRPAQVDIDGAPTYRPHQFDTDELTVMKVEEWRADSGPVAFQPELSGDHPRFYVADGSHSLYTTPGDQDVDPYPPDKQPRGCGGYDDPALSPPGTPGPGELSTAQWIAIIAKIVTGGFGLGFVGGVVAAVLEAIPATGPFGASGPGNDTPDPDQPPTSVAQSVMVHPADVSDPAALGRVEPWRSQQGLLLDGRTYDFVVDRETQVWWPNDDHERGFRGRWGQRVSTDPLSRRCGPKFPDYVNMFLSALEDGITRGFFKL